MAKTSFWRSLMYAGLVSGILSCIEVGIYAHYKFPGRNLLNEALEQLVIADQTVINQTSQTVIAPPAISNQAARPNQDFDKINDFLNEEPLENYGKGERIITATFTPGFPLPVREEYTFAQPETNQVNLKEISERIDRLQGSPKKRFKELGERALKESIEKKVIAPVPQERVIKYDDLKDCSAKAEPNTNQALEQLRQSLKKQESSGRITAQHKKTGAAGYFGYLPQTAISIVKQAKSEGISVPYTGPLTESAVQRELLTNPKFNEFVSKYDLTKRAKIFDNNRGLLAMTHYAGPKEIEQALRIVYPGKEDYTNINVREFAFARAKGIKIIEKEDGEKKYIKMGKGNAWLLKPQDYGCPSILRYAESVLGKMGYSIDTSINSVLGHASSEKKVQKDSQYKQKPQKKYYVSNKHYHKHKKTNYKHR